MLLVAAVRRWMTVELIRLENRGRTALGDTEPGQSWIQNYLNYACRKYTLQSQILHNVYYVSKFLLSNFY